MNPIDAIVVIICSLLLIVIGGVLALVPLPGLNDFFIDKLGNIISNLNRDYLISFLGVLLIFMAIKLMSLIFSSKKTKGKGYISRESDKGSIEISSNTVIQIVKEVIAKTGNLKNFNVATNMDENSLKLVVSGDIKENLDIIEVSKELQENIREKVEFSTGLPVDDVKIYIENLSKVERKLK